LKSTPSLGLFVTVYMLNNLKHKLKIILLALQ